MKKILPYHWLTDADFTRKGGIKGLQRYGKQASGTYSTVDKVLFPGGYATISGTAVTFHYYTQDYLGNNRAVINGSTGAIEQTIAYYPFGAVIADLGTPTTGQPYKFGGKELLTTNGLNEYDFGARNYYPAVPSFTKPDQMCERYYWLSPYLYCASNPVNYTDPTGMIFTEASEKYINQFMSNIESRIQSNNNEIAKKKAELSKAGLSEKKINKINKSIARLDDSNAVLQSVVSEIETLSESSQVYNVFRDNSFNTSGDPFGFGGEIRSGVRYNEQTDMFDIMLGDDSLGMLSHELKHAYQFEIGNFSSGYLKNGQPFYDITDEYEAYERGYMFGQPKNNAIKQQYNHLQPTSASVNMLAEYIKNNPSYLQDYANKSHSVFRWKRVTYKGKR